MSMFNQRGSAPAGCVYSSSIAHRTAHAKKAVVRQALLSDRPRRVTLVLVSLFSTLFRVTAHSPLALIQQPATSRRQGACAGTDALRLV